MSGVMRSPTDGDYRRRKRKRQPSEAAVFDDQRPYSLHSGSDARDNTAALARAEVRFDQATQLGVWREQMNVHFVGAELSTAATDLGEVQRSGRIADAADGEHQTTAFRIAMDEDVIAGRDRGALDQAVNGVNVATAGSAAPEVEALGEIRRTVKDCGAITKNDPPVRAG